MIRKAVIPAAGLGTRLMPATQSIPKVMLPVVDKPVLQYVVDEAIASGIREILIIVGRDGKIIEEHFARGPKAAANIQFVVQPEQRGLGDAVAMARAFAGNESFAVLLGDAILESEQPVTKQLAEIATRFNACAVALEEIPPDKAERYGVAEGEPADERVIRVRRLIEKPARGETSSNLVIAARYVFTPDIFDCLARTGRGKNNEIQLTDAMALLLKDHAMYGLQFRGTRWDIGNKFDYMKANAALSLRHPEHGAQFRAFLTDMKQLAP